MKSILHLINRSLKVLPFALIMATAFSCHPDEPMSTVLPQASQGGARKQALDKVQVAKILAKVVLDEDVRVLLKAEALKKFDGDYDILFQMVKDKKIKGNKSLFDAIAEKADMPGKFKSLSDDLPLLTFYVPTFFSALKWDTKQQVPFIAVRDEDNKLMLYNHKGESMELNPLEEPDVPMLVVKINDRVTTTPPKNEKGRIMANNFLFSNGQHSFYLTEGLTESLASTKKGARFFVNDNGIDPVVVEAYQKSLNCNTCHQRDWIYYGINPASGQDSGPLNYRFKEAITQFRLENINSFQDLGGWDQGNYQFRIYPMFMGKGVTEKTPPTKVLFIAPEQVYTYHTEPRCINHIFWVSCYSVRIVDDVQAYILPSPIIVDTWSMEDNGNRWFFKVEKYNPTVDTERTVVETSEFSTNFSFSASIGEKVKLGPSLGFGTKSTQQTTFKYKTTTGSLDLGYGILRYEDPVITSRFSLPGTTTILGNTYDVTTGATRLSIETVRSY
ncbi:hypothetical protein [Fibrella aquatilis]|uniref:Cytochrome c domain-containing protein n=1 Tax=Fibrella aquatilis TaxID=2817059 RepID=A0A939GDK7_9BACT|nr:hypothetical protein [Fibrella aquatilis]MBO0934890.1 hypothetical protein [Fibrella aquatilis]